MFCCKNCKPPERHAACHDTCEKYIKEKAEYKRQQDAFKKEYSPVHDAYRSNLFAKINKHGGKKI